MKADQVGGVALIVRSIAFLMRAGEIPAGTPPTVSRHIPSVRPSRIRRLIFVGFLQFVPLIVLANHDPTFWKQIRANKFTPPPNESPGKLAIEIADLAANPDPTLRDECGYEILAAWIYRDQLLSGDELEALRRKFIPGMTFRIGESETDSIFRRSFSALYLSILAAEDLQKPFLSDTAFRETLDAALQCYAEEKDLRGYVPEKGWAHATAHVADLLKLLARSPKLSGRDQKKIVEGIAGRCRTVPAPLVWGEDARMAAALLSIVNRKDFEPSIFDDWFKMLIAQNQHLWKEPKIDTSEYVSVRTQINVLAQLAAKSGPEKDKGTLHSFRDALQTMLSKVD